MSFDDVLQPRRSNPEEDVPRKTSSPSPSSQKKGESILTNLDIGEWAKNAGISEELTQQVIVPLVAILDKHGGKIISTESREVQAATSFASALTDFLPLIQGAYSYFNGVRKELNAADEALLEAHSAAISATELSNMFGDDTEIESEPIQETQQPQQSQSFGPEGFNPPQASNQIIQSGKVDYYELMGYGSEESFNQAIGETQPTTNIYTSQQERLEEQIGVKNTQGLPEKEGGIVSLDALTLEQGMSAYEVKRGDTQEKIDNGFVMDGVEITNERVADDLREIQSLMNQEKMNHKMNSKIAVESQEMSAQEIIDDMKAKANPSRGGQRVGEAPNKGGTTISVSDAELASLASSAFDIPGLAELQQAEANQAKANSKMNETAQKLPQEESDGLTPLTWDDAIGEGILSTTDVENEN